jgi:hypothetical protein
MNYLQAAICVNCFLQTNFLLPRSEFVGSFVKYIIQNTKLPSITPDLILFSIGLNNVNESDWAEDLIQFLMKKLLIRRDYEAFLEDIDIYYDKGEQQMIQFIIDSSAFCRENNIRRIPEAVDVDEISSIEGFFKHLDLKDLTLTNSKSYI